MNSFDENGVDSQWVAYDYAIVRVVPRVHLEVFANIGVVLHARTANFLETKLRLNEEQLRALWPALNLEMLRRALDAYERVCRGGIEAAPVGLLPPSERFHWLTAPRSAVLQVSSVRPGRCLDPQKALDELFRCHVGEC